MSHADQQIFTALLLAAGTGTRLSPLTANMPKCLTRVNGIPILERLMSSLIRHRFRRLIVVTGYMDHCIRSFLKPYSERMEISFVHSDQYRTTNNIYSLWRARNEIKDPFLLLESDLVFDPECIGPLLTPDRIAIAQVKPWMDGTMVSVDRYGKVNRFLGIHETEQRLPLYKTVNIYSLSLESWQYVIQELDLAIRKKKFQAYYEYVFSKLVRQKQLELTPVFFDKTAWYEIDTIEDLIQAEKLFAGCLKSVTPEVGAGLGGCRSTFAGNHFIEN
ncbi:sugar phosphate nucleotidyltransferase [Desulfobacter curvatus]|uniref:phosphocholine cytidylyltransferase family protein n=1 Tax=Desulfobacter curvatus TaxID=2290 RepID=UPI00036FDA41|nr:phosphocholine cytidylyltransferase family protein [Desulfobacter curvatus]